MPLPRQFRPEKCPSRLPHTERNLRKVPLSAHGTEAQRGKFPPSRSRIEPSEVSPLRREFGLLWSPAILQCLRKVAAAAAAFES